MTERISPFWLSWKYQCIFLYNEYFKNNLWCLFYHFLNGTQGDTAKRSFKETGSWMGVGEWGIFKKVATQIIQEVSGREKQVRTTEDKSVTRFTGRNPENKTEGKRLWAGLMMGFSNKQESKTRIKGECPAEPKTHLQGDMCMVLGCLILKPGKLIFSQVYRFDNIFPCEDYIKLGFM